MKTKADPRQEELALSSIASHALFPGRTVLRVAEVAKALRVTEQHVVDLITECRLVAVDIRGALKTAQNPGGNATSRNCLRIPVSAFDAFVAANANASKPS